MRLSFSFTVIVIKKNNIALRHFYQDFFSFTYFLQVIMFTNIFIFNQHMIRDSL